MTTKSNFNTVFCDTHKSMTLDIYCKDHDDVICRTCKITDHKKCTTTDVSDQKRRVDITKSLDEAIKSLTDTKLQCEMLKEARKTDKMKVTSQLSKCLEDMRNMRKEINLTFDKLERKFEEEVRATEERMKKEMEDHITIAEDVLTQISDQIKSLRDCRKTNNDDVMFVGMKKATNLKSKYDHILSTIQQTIFPIRIQFRANGMLNDVLNQLNSIGSLDGLAHPSTSNQSTASLLEMSVGDKREFVVGVKSVYDCTFMKSGHLVLACGSGGLVLLDESFKVLSHDNITSFSVAAINENEVVVTQGNEQKLLRVLLPQMDAMATVKMDGSCLGADVFDNEIYVGCYDDKGHGKLQVLNMDGKIQRKLGVSKGKYMFRSIAKVKMSRDGSKIFVSDDGTHTDTCLNPQGHVFYRYSDLSLKTPCGLYVGEDNTLLVCGCESMNIHMVDRDGRKVKIWLTEKAGMVYPMCVSYRQKDGCLIVGLSAEDGPILVFSTKQS